MNYYRAGANMHNNHRWLRLIAGLSFTVLSFTAFAVSTSDFPPTAQLVGRDNPITTSAVFQTRPVFLLVSSHSTADLLKAVPVAWLDQGLNIPANRFVSVAAVSKAPWLVKKLFIGSGLSRLVGERTELLEAKIPEIKDSPVIIDMEGEMVAALQLDDLGKTEYAIFIINQAGEVQPLLRSKLLDDSEAGIESAARKIVQAAKPHFMTQY